MIHVENIAKMYRLYSSPKDRLKEAIHPLRKKYHNEFYALQNINFSVERGECVGIIGENGSGKSTLLKMITGVLRPTSGSIVVNGRISSILELGTGFNPEYTGLENIYLNGTLFGFSREEMDARLQSIIDFADIGEFISQPVKTYSSGMFARLSFSVAINVEPEVLIVDEALSVGDVFFQNKCFRKFDELREKNVTILFVSHDMSSVRKLCSKVLWIDAGQQQQFGECQEVCDLYFNSQIERVGKYNEAYLHELEVDKAEVIEVKEKRRYPKLPPPRPTDKLSDKAEILSVFVRDEHGNIVTNLKADNRYTVTVVTQFHERLENVIVGFILENSRGLRVFGTNTYMQEERGVDVTAEEVVQIDFTFVMPRIEPGQYLITVAPAVGTVQNHTNLTWLHGIIAVDVERHKNELEFLGMDYDIEIDSVNEMELY
jgi:ABC-type polysaccharide/polyol phosphate transport system, ATPase component